VLRAGPVSAVIFVVYEQVMLLLKPKKLSLRRLTSR
jgi:hypothetical protein